jgi:hypothetical protein
LTAAIVDYVDDTYRSPGARRYTPCPLPLAFVLLGERFGGWPWELEQAPLDRVNYYLAVMAAEAEAHQDHDGLSGDETVIRM